MCPRGMRNLCWGSYFFMVLSLITSASDASSIVTLTGQPTDVGFGVSVCIPGDLNGDGIDDVTVGATTFDFVGQALPGRIYIYFGGGEFAAPNLVLSGEANGDRFGYVHSTAGDFDGDGYLDLLVGAYQNDANGGNSGRAYVFRGGPGIDSTPDVIITGISGEQLGIAVAGVGDVNDDGKDDILIGARFNTVGGSEAGRAYVYYGGPTMDNLADLTLNSQSPMEQLGFAVAGGQDVNGDGHADFMVGAYHNSALGFETGRVYVYFGGPAVDAAIDLVLDGAGERAHFGDALGVADANGDGHADILVGASQYSIATGRAYAYYGGPSIDNVADLTLQPGGLGDWSGRFVAGGGDFNQDGVADILIGAPALNSAGPGRAYLYHGGPLLDSSFDLALDGEVAGDAFGWNGWAGPQDVDADGSHDLIIGAFRNDAGGQGVGRAYLFLSDANRRPDCSAATPTLTQLWPPNNNLVTVGVTGVSDPDGDPTTVRITAISSDELTRARRNDRCPDAVIAGETAQLRAESADPGNGRVYTLHFVAEDPSGASCEGTVTVCVPRAVNSQCQDDGPLADATVCTPFASRTELLVRSFPSGVQVSFELDADGPVRAKVYDVRGRFIQELARGAYPTGHNNLVWDGRERSGNAAPNGIYVLKLTVAGSTEVAKFALIR